MPPRSAFTAWFTPAMRRFALWGCALSLALPWVLVRWLGQGVQPGLYRDAERAALLMDYIAWGACLFGLSMVLTVLVGCWVVAVMKGPHYRGDAFPDEATDPAPGDVSAPGRPTREAPHA
jgi:hypothetical protein